MTRSLRCNAEPVDAGADHSQPQLPDEASCSERPPRVRLRIRCLRGLHRTPIRRQTRRSNEEQRNPGLPQGSAHSVVISVVVPNGHGPYRQPLRSVSSIVFSAGLSPRRSFCIAPRQASSLGAAIPTKGRDKILASGVEISPLRPRICPNFVPTMGSELVPQSPAPCPQPQICT